MKPPVSLQLYTVRSRLKINRDHDPDDRRPRRVERLTAWLGPPPDKSVRPRHDTTYRGPFQQYRGSGLTLTRLFDKHLSTLYKCHVYVLRAGSAAADWRRVRRRGGGEHRASAGLTANCIEDIHTTRHPPQCPRSCAPSIPWCDHKSDQCIWEASRKAAVWPAPRSRKHANEQASACSNLHRCNAAGVSPDGMDCT